MDALAIVLVVLAVAFGTFALGLATGVHLQGRRYRKAVTMIDGTVFRRDREHDGDGNAVEVQDR